MYFISQSSDLLTISQHIFLLICFFFLQFLHVIARKTRTISFSPPAPPVLMLATCSVFSPLRTAWKELLCPFKHPVKLTASQKDNDLSSGGIQGNALSFFPAAFWKRNKALVAVGLHRSPGCRRLRYLPPRGCSPALTYPEKAQLYKQPLQSRVSADPGQTARPQQRGSGVNRGIK